MKILVAASLYYPYIKGGGEISTKILVEGLFKKGLNVSVVTVGKEYREEVINGVKIYRIPTPNIYWSFESFKQPKYKKLLWHFMDSYNIRVRKYFINILKKENPDILHSSTIEDLSPYIWKVSKEYGVKVIHTLRSYTLLCPKAIMYKNDNVCDNRCIDCRLITLPKKNLSKYVDGVVGISRFILDKHLKYGYFKNAKIKRVIYNPVKMIDTCKKDNENKEIILGFVGRLEKNKGIEFLLKNYIKSNFSYPLYIYGSTQDKNYEKYLKDKFRDNRIKFLGYHSQESIYNTITHLIVPSLWNEPFGRIVPEANSYGIPVLVSNRGGLPELIKEGRNGYIFDPNKQGDFEYKLRLMIEIFKKRRVLFNSDDFDISRILNKYLEVYSL